MQTEQRELFTQQNNHKTHQTKPDVSNNKRPPKLINPLGLDGFPFTKPRYKWPDAPSWWNPLGEEISEEIDNGESVLLAYYGRTIPRHQLIQVNLFESSKNYNTVKDGQIFKVSNLLED